jgi:hypothetical protein
LIQCDVQLGWRSPRDIEWMRKLNSKNVIFEMDVKFVVDDFKHSQKHITEFDSLIIEWRPLSYISFKLLGRVGQVSMIFY